MISVKDLILCDAFAAKKFLNNLGEPQAMVDLSCENVFSERLSKDKVLNKVSRIFFSIYEQTHQKGFHILPDRFGGFGIFNKSNKVIKPSFTPLEFPLGIVEKLPSALRAEVTELSITRSSRDSAEKVLLGSCRFSNHSCSPNVKYFQGFSCDLPYPCVRLQVLKSIEPNEELTVFYGDSFFGNGNKDCLCDFPSYHHDSEDETEVPSGISQLTNTPLAPTQVSSDAATSETPEINLEFNEHLQTQGSTSHKRTAKLQRKRRIKFLSSFETNEASLLLSQTQREARFFDSPSDNQTQEIDESSDEIYFTANSEVETDVHLNSDSETELIASDAKSQSSSSTDSSVSDSSSIINVDSDVPGFDFGLEIMKNNISVQNSVMSLLSITTNRSAPDELLYDLIKRERLIDDSKTFPSYHFVKKVLSAVYEKYNFTHHLYPKGELILMSFFTHLSRVVTSNIDQIIKYSKCKSSNADIKLEPLISFNKLRIRLIINTDGAKVRKSSAESAYPLWISIADLPPIMRSSFKNITLASVWYGDKDVDWDKIFEHYSLELEKPIEVSVDSTTYKIEFVTVMHIADLVCKAEVLQMKQFNGYYGCWLCTLRGVHRFGAHFYPHSKSFEMRSPNKQKVCADFYIRKDHIKRAKEADPEINTLGVKGYPKLFNVISNLPLTSPVDTMHQLYNGVAKDMLDFFVTLNGSISSVDCAIEIFRPPNEFKRRIRALKYRSYFKANEMKVFLLYLFPIIFPHIKTNEFSKSNIRDVSYLVFALRSMYETDQNAKMCGNLLEAFCLSMSKKYPLKSFDSINFHLLRHLAWQVKLFGPLWVTSAMSFESANHHLIQPVTGTVNICNLLVQRYIRKKEIECSRIKDDALKLMLNKSSVSMEFWEGYNLEENTNTIFIRRLFPQSRLFCRYRLKSPFPSLLDSLSYRRSNSNSFVLLREDPPEAAQILLFFEESNSIKCYVECFNVVVVIRLDLQGTVFESAEKLFRPLAYVIGETVEKKQVSVNSITRKLAKFEFRNLVYLLSLLNHFEHD